jgi:hypothetical protein
MLTKKFHKGVFTLLNILLVVFLLVFLVGNTAGVYVTGTLNDAGLRSAYVTRLMDTVYNNLGTDSIDKLEQIQADIEARPELSSITEKYTDAFIAGVWNDAEYEDITVDISGEIDGLLQFVVDEINTYVTLPTLLSNLVTQMVMSQEENATAAVNAYAKGIYQNIQENYAPLVKMYYVLTSETFLAVMFALIILLVLAIIALSPLKVSKFSMPIVAVLTGVIYYVGANVVAGRVVMTFSNKMLGRTVSLNTSQSIVMLEKLIAVALVLTVVLFVADLFVGNKNKKNVAGEVEK